MAALDLLREPRPVAGQVERLSPLVRRILAPNPGPFTYHGTGTFVIGNGTVAVLDPGPDDDDHVAAILRALDGETIAHIVVTHTHRDHSPAAAPLQARTGAPTAGFRALAPTAPAATLGANAPFAPDLVLDDGDALVGPGWHLAAIHTPGHASNHLCYALPEEATLFTGDHVMGWSSSVISPPDGDMIAYMVSLAAVAARPEPLYRPAHGPAILDGPRFAAALIEHRRARSAGILAALADGPKAIPALVAALYPGLSPDLVAAAGRSVLAHLLALHREGRVSADGEPGLDAVFALRRR